MWLGQNEQGGRGDRQITGTRLGAQQASGGQLCSGSNRLLGLALPGNLCKRFHLCEKVFPHLREGNENSCPHPLPGS